MLADRERFKRWRLPGGGTGVPSTPAQKGLPRLAARSDHEAWAQLVVSQVVASGVAKSNASPPSACRQPPGIRDGVHTIGLTISFTERGTPGAIRGGGMVLARDWVVWPWVADEALVQPYAKVDLGPTATIPFPARRTTCDKLPNHNAWRITVCATVLRQQGMLRCMPVDFPGRCRYTDRQPYVSCRRRRRQASDGSGASGARPPSHPCRKRCILASYSDRVCQDLPQCIIPGFTVCP